MSLTSSLAYTIKPTSISARSYTHSCNPVNGNSFIAGDQIKIDIPCGVFGSYLDSNNSFMKLTFTNDSGQTYTLDSSILSVVQRMTVEYSGYLLEDVDNLNVLSSIFMDNQIDYETKRTSVCLTHGTSGARDRAGLSFANTTFQNFTFGLPSFILGLTASKYLPLTALTSSDSLRLTLYLADAGVPVVCGNAAHTGTYKISNVTFEAAMIKLEESAEMMVRNSTKMNFKMSGETFRSFNSTLAATDTASLINIPVKCSSLKTLIVAHRYAADIAAKNKQSITNRTKCDLTEYHFEVGSLRIPQKPVKCNASCAEVFTGNQKALHHFGDRHSGISFDPADFVKTATTDAGGAFVIMLDTESVYAKGEVLNSGTSTVSQTVFFSGVYDAIPAQAICTSFAHFDCMLEIGSDGIARVLF